MTVSIIKEKLQSCALKSNDIRAAIASFLKQAGTIETPQDELDRLLFDFQNVERFRARLACACGIAEADMFVLGPLDDRVVVRRAGATDGILSCLGRRAPDSQIAARLAQWIGMELVFTDACARFVCPLSFWDRLEFPKVFLCALYHPENFPLPRFSLGIADVARALRAELVSDVRLADMQLGDDVIRLARKIRAHDPHVLGISATFGQDDVLNALLDELGDEFLTSRELVFGGSLCALNRRSLLQRWPKAYVAAGAGEPTIGGLLDYWRGELALDAVPALAYRNAAGEIVATPALSNRHVDEMTPELDLLDETLEKFGVMQLESSRGCSYACSFCPRSHKGIWTGDAPNAFDAILPAVARTFDAHPSISRKIFLVDEEFIGYRPDAEGLARVVKLSENLQGYGFAFETSSRADQVSRPHKSAEWHSRRIEVWRHLVDKGLERCLFGIESGVDSILQRFNKKTTSAQNATAIRIISLAGVPPRYTYITFDPLMSREELLASYAFQGRRDLLLRRSPELSSDDIFAVATSDAKSASHSTGQPFYTQISYMLVSMECLIGAPYTEAVRSAGLLGAENDSMGRFDSAYRDPEIGLFSEFAQRWIDRNFDFDYLLKSCEKYLPNDKRGPIRAQRVVFREKAYEVLGLMLHLSNADDVALPASLSAGHRLRAEQRRAAWPGARASLRQSREILTDVLDAQFDALKQAMAEACDGASEHLDGGTLSRIRDLMRQWSARTGWKLINAAEPEQV